MKSDAIAEPIESPCINVCQLNSVDLNDPNTFCKGCYRTVTEIAKWGRMTALERRAIMQKLSARRTAGSDKMPNDGTA